jgi:dipeptidase
MKRAAQGSSLLLASAALWQPAVEACTSIIVTPGASENGSMTMSYSSDDHKSYGQLYHYPKTSNNEDGDTVDVYEWESGDFLGRIPQMKDTYNVVGSCNEHNVCVAETTFGGPPELLQPHPDSLVDYGSLMYLALQRSTTAKEALDVMTNLGETHGYHSEGESFSLVDPNEAYLLEMISKGHHEVGALWVACLVPDGSIVVHANHARITTFLNDESCTHSADVVDIALQLGLYQPLSSESDYSDFSFSDTYSPKQPYELRYTDARVWDVYRAFLHQDDQQAFDDAYLPHIMGHEAVGRQNALPIWFVPQHKVSVKDIRTRMSSHYEGTPLEYGGDVAGGMFEMPYKPRPNNWLYSPDNIEPPKMYVNERPIAVEKTGFNLIAEIRPLKSPFEPNNVPGVVHPRLQTVMWYATDDCSTAPRIPVFPSATAVSKHYAGMGSQQGHRAPIMEFDMAKSFWIQNLVSNLAYYRWKDIYPLLQDKLDEVHSSFEARVEHVQHQVTTMVEDQDMSAIEMMHWFHPSHHNGRSGKKSQNHRTHKVEKQMDALDEEIVRKLTDFTVHVGNDMHHEWVAYWGFLFVRFRDFTIMQVDPSNKQCGCHSHEVGISHKWQTRIVQERGDHFRVAMDDASKEGYEKTHQTTQQNDTHKSSMLPRPQKVMLVEAKELDTLTKDLKLAETVRGSSTDSRQQKSVMDSSQPWFASHPLSKTILSLFGN